MNAYQVVELSLALIVSAISIYAVITHPLAKVGGL